MSSTSGIGPPFSFGTSNSSSISQSSRTGVVPDIHLQLSSSHSSWGSQIPPNTPQILVISQVRETTFHGNSKRLAPAELADLRPEKFARLTEGLEASSQSSETFQQTLDAQKKTNEKLAKMIADSKKSAQEFHEKSSNFATPSLLGSASVGNIAPQGALLDRVNNLENRVASLEEANRRLQDYVIRLGGALQAPVPSSSAPAQSRTLSSLTSSPNPTLAATDFNRLEALKNQILKFCKETPNREGSFSVRTGPLIAGITSLQNGNLTGAPLKLRGPTKDSRA